MHWNIKWGTFKFFYRQYSPQKLFHYNHKRILFEIWKQIETETIGESTEPEEDSDITDISWDGLLQEETPVTYKSMILFNAIKLVQRPKKNMSLNKNVFLAHASILVSNAQWSVRNKIKHTASSQVRHTNWITHLESTSSPTRTMNHSDTFMLYYQWQTIIALSVKLTRLSQTFIFFSDYNYWKRRNICW